MLCWMESRFLRTLLKQDSFKQRVLVPQHQAFIGGRTMTLLQSPKGLFVLFNGGFELFDVLGPAFAKRSLCLSIALLAFLRCRIDLASCQCRQLDRRRKTLSLTGFLPPLRF